MLLAEDATITVLEAAMRALTFYLDVSGDCARRIVGVEGAVEGICKRLTAANLLVQNTRDLAMQCVKVRQAAVTRKGSASGLRRLSPSC